jgi:hypothetical protein
MMMTAPSTSNHGHQVKPQAHNVNTTTRENRRGRSGETTMEERVRLRKREKQFIKEC